MLVWDLRWTHDRYFSSCQPSTHQPCTHDVPPKCSKIFQTPEEVMLISPDILSQNGNRKWSPSTLWHHDGGWFCWVKHPPKEYLVYKILKIRVLHGTPPGERELHRTNPKLPAGRFIKHLKVPFWGYWSLISRDEIQLRRYIIMGRLLIWDWWEWVIELGCTLCVLCCRCCCCCCCCFLTLERHL